MIVSSGIINAITNVLFQAVTRAKCQSEATEQLTALQHILQDQVLGGLFRTRKLTLSHRRMLARIIKEVVANKLLYDFLDFLVIKQKLGFLVLQIIDRYFMVLEQQKYKNKCTISIKFAGELSQRAQSDIKQKLQILDTDRFNVNFIRDDRLLYGIQIFKGNYMLDLSARKRLRELQFLD